MEGHMADENSGVYETTAAVLMFHPNLHTPKAFKGKGGKENGEPKYSGNFAMKPDHPDLNPMKKAAAAVAKAKWPGRSLKELAFPFANGDAKADLDKARGKNSEYNRGYVIMAARSKFEPRLVAFVNKKIVEVTAENRTALKDKFFFGAEAFIEVNFVAYEGVGNNPDGVTAYLNKVQVTGKGTRIAAAGGVSEHFRNYVGAASGEDPTASSAEDDDEVPF
jgi:Protein of unknown function (DUF2815)